MSMHPGGGSASRTLRAVFSVDTAEAERGLDRVASKTEQTASRMERAGQGAEQLGTKTVESSRRGESALGRMARSIEDNGSEWRQVGGTLATVGAATTGLGAVVAKTGIEYNTLRQTSTAALTTLLGSAEAAADQMDRLDEFASTSPFARQVWIEAQQQLIGFGMEAEQVVPTMDAIQDAVAATGGSNQDIADLSRIIAQVGASGKITAQELREFGNRGVDAAEIIGSQMGKTGAQIREEITAGTLDADEAIAALTAGMSERFGGAAENMRNTFAGATDRLRAAFRDLSASATRWLVDPEGNGGFLVDLVNQAADLLRWLERLPAPIRDTVAALAGVGGVAALAAGSFFLLAPRLVAMGDAVTTLATTMPRLTGAMRGVRSVLLGPWGIALAAGVTALGLYAGAQQRTRERIQEVRDTLDEQTGALTDNTREWASSLAQQEGALEWAADLGLAAGTVTDALMGIPKAQREVAAAAEEAKLAWVKDSDAMRVATGESAERADSARRLTDFLAAQTGVVGDALAEEARYRAEVEGSTEVGRLHADVIRENVVGLADLARNVDETHPVLGDMVAAQEAAAEAAAQHTEELAQQSEAFVSGSDALSAVKGSMQEWAQEQADAVNEANAAAEALAAEQGESLDTVSASWEDFWDGHSIGLDDWLTELESMQEAQREWEQNMILLSARASESLIDNLRSMGPEGAQIVADLVDAGGEELARAEAVWGGEAAVATRTIADNMRNSDPIIRAAAARWGEGIAEEVAAKLADGETTAAEIIAAYDLQATIDLGADPLGFVTTLGASLAEADTSEGTPSLGLGTAMFFSTLTESLTQADTSTGTASLDADSSLFNAELSASLGRADGSTGTPDLDSDPSRFLSVLAASLRDADTSTGTPDLDSNPALFVRKLAQNLRDADTSTGTPDLDANDRPGRGVWSRFLNAVDTSTGTIDVDARTNLASDAMSAFRTRWDNMSIGLRMLPGIGSMFADGGLIERADGGIDQAGRRVPREPMMGGPAYGRTNVLWGEPETGWEAYISGKPGMRARNISVLEEAAHRLGMTVLDGLDVPENTHIHAFADGGMLSPPWRWTMDSDMGDTDAWRTGILAELAGWVRENATMGHPIGVPVGPRSYHRYGWRKLFAVPDFHQGVDYPAATGTPVTAPGTGRVSHTASRGGGVQLEMAHLSGMHSAFLHLSSRLARAGQLVNKGDVVARSGNTGTMTTGPHLHWQVGRGANAWSNTIDPLRIIGQLADGGILDALKRPQVADTGHVTFEPGWNLTYDGLGRREHMVDVARLAASYAGGGGTEQRFAPPPQAPQQVTVHIDGARLTSGWLEMRGDGMARIADARIEADHSHNRYASSMVGISTARTGV